MVAVVGYDDELPVRGAMHHRAAVRGRWTKKEGRSMADVCVFFFPSLFFFSIFKAFPLSSNLDTK